MGSHETFCALPHKIMYKRKGHSDNAENNGCLFSISDQMHSRQNKTAACRFSL